MEFERHAEPIMPENEHRSIAEPRALGASPMLDSQERRATIS